MGKKAKNKKNINKRKAEKKQRRVKRQLKERQSVSKTSFDTQSAENLKLDEHQLAQIYQYLPENKAQATELLQKFTNCSLGTAKEKIAQFLKQDDLLNKSAFAKIYLNSKKIETLKNYSNEQLIGILEDFGVKYNEKVFLKEVKKYDCSLDLVMHWEDKFGIANITGLDESIMCEIVNLLIERLTPDTVNNDKINKMMQDGYSFVEKNKSVDACLLWLQVWEHLKKRFTLKMNSIEQAEDVFHGLQYLSNWCQDFEMELCNAGLSDPSFYKKRIKYCEEFCTLFPQTDSQTLHNMKRAKAESYFALGNIEEGEKAFEILVKEFPNNEWGYIGWGDIYCDSENKEIINYEKAEHLYRKALEIAKDKQTILLRLEDLAKNDE